MILLNATTKSLEVKLAGARATTAPSFVSSAVDHQAVSPFAITGHYENDGVLNGATAVTLVAAPGASTTRQVKFFSVYNADTAAVVLTLQYNNNGTIRPIGSWPLAVGKSFIFADGSVFGTSDVSSNVGLLNTTNTWDLAQSFTAGIKERGRTALVGEWTTPSFNAADFTGGGSQTWTLVSGDVTTFAYIIIGKTMWVSWLFITTSVGGTPDPKLSVAIPGGYVAAKRMGTSMNALDNLTLAASAFCEVLAGGTTINFYLDYNAATNWAASTNQTYMQGQMCFEVQ